MAPRLTVLRRSIRNRSRPARAAAVGFGAFGLVVGTWGSRVASVEHRVMLSTGEFGLALLAMTIGALLALPASARLLDRGRNRDAVAGGFAFCIIGLALLGVATDVTVLTVGLFLLGVGEGALELGVNAEAMALEHEVGGPRIAGLYSLFSAGTLAGAGLGAGAAALGIEPAVQFLAIDVLLACTARTTLLTGAAKLPVRARRRHTSGHAGWASLGVWVVLFAQAGVGSWCAVFCLNDLRASAGVASASFTFVTLVTAAARAGGNRAEMLIGLRGLLLYAPLAATCGLVLFASAGPLVFGFGGLLLYGAGSAVLLPLLYRLAATHLWGLTTAAAVGYIGFATGPTIVGAVASLAGLRLAFVLMAGAFLALTSIGGRLARGSIATV